MANAIHVWGVAQVLNGRVLLRLEDHDRRRCRPEYEAAILEDLEWLGLEPQHGLPAELRSGRSPFRQGDNDLRYAAALQQLGSRFKVYNCDCSRKEIAGESDVPDQETRYPARCRDRNLEDQEGRGIRVMIEPGTERFIDGLLGEQEQDPSAQCGDLLLKDRLGNWTYQFAVTVDDIEQNVDLVIRGQDLLASTGLRAAGMSPGRVLGQAAYLTGLIDTPRELSARDLGSLFISSEAVS